MKLYYSPGACSLSPHIVLREARVDFELERVDTVSHKTETGADYMQINPKGYVPALRLDDGQILTEGVAIVQYIADLYPEAGLAPKPETLARARLHEHLNFISSELHKSFGPFFSSISTEAEKTSAGIKVRRRFDHVESIFADGRSYLLGEQFSIADAYLYAISNWTQPTGIGLEKWPHVARFVTRVAARQPVGAAMRAEGLI